MVDSAGTNGYHTREAPDRRSVAVARQHGIDISRQRCRQLTPHDFTRFDLILGMDHTNVAAIEARRSLDGTAATGLFCSVALGEPIEIPDPYYGTAADFDRVYRMVLAASKGLSKLF